MKYLLISLIFLIGCLHQSIWTNNIQSSYGNTRIINVYIDKDFDKKDEGNIEKSIDTWNYSLNHNIELKIISFNMQIDSIEDGLAHGIIIMKIDSSSKFIPNNSKETLAWSDKIGGHKIFIIHDRIRERKLDEIMLHEIGHILGAEHKDGGLMFKHYNEFLYSCVDEETAKQISLYQKIEFNSMNYCKII